MRSQKSRAALILAVAGLALGGCAGKSADPTVASAATAGPAASPTPDAVTAYVDGQRVWVKCLRGQGFDVPDPDAKGSVDFATFLSTSKLSKADPAFVAAQRACQSVQPTYPAELEPALPPLTPEQLANARAYSRCMRANGMPDWPDPLPDGGYADNAFGTGELTPAQQDANTRALQICDPVLNGQPPASYDPSRVAQG